MNQEKKSFSMLLRSDTDAAAAEASKGPVSAFSNLPTLEETKKAKEALPDFQKTARTSVFGAPLAKKEDDVPAEGMCCVMSVNY